MLWKVNRANIMLMMADRSNVKSMKAEDAPATPITGQDLANRYKQKQQ